MKKLTAIFLSILLLLLCGCGSIGEKINKTYNDINSIVSGVSDVVSDVVSGVVAQTVDTDSIEVYDIVIIKPSAVAVQNGELAAYKKLTLNQKKLYSIILSAVENMELRNINITDYVSGDGFSDSIIAHRAIMCDRPDIFWMPKTISILSVKGKKTKYLAFRNYGDKNNQKGYYGITKEQKDTMLSQLNSAVDRILLDAAMCGDDFDRELYLHDYICENVTYDQAAADDMENADRNVSNAYGALVEGKAICEGYSRAFQLLCMNCGIPCSVIYGEHDNVSHMWNIVNAGDGLYYLDSTFDDSAESSTLHIYFNLTKSEILKDHKFDADFVSGKTYSSDDSFNFYSPDCKNTALNFYEKKGAYIDEDCSLAINEIRTQMQNGKNSA